VNELGGFGDFEQPGRGDVPPPRQRAADTGGAALAELGRTLAVSVIAGATCPFVIGFAVELIGGLADVMAAAQGIRAAARVWLPDGEPGVPALVWSADMERLEEVRERRRLAELGRAASGTVAGPPRPPTRRSPDR
jgi:hypothetical protein